MLGCRVGRIGTSVRPIRHLDPRTRGWRRGTTGAAGYTRTRGHDDDTTTPGSDRYVRSRVTSSQLPGCTRSLSPVSWAHVTLSHSSRAVGGRVREEEGEVGATTPGGRAAAEARGAIEAARAQSNVCPPPFCRREVLLEWKVDSALTWSWVAPHAAPPATLHATIGDRLTGTPTLAATS